MDEPADTAVITPVLGSIVATAGVPEDQVPASPFEVKDVEPVLHITCVPLNIPAFGAAVTVTVLVAVAFAQPPVPVMV